MGSADPSGKQVLALALSGTAAAFLALLPGAHPFSAQDSSAQDPAAPPVANTVSEEAGRAEYDRAASLYRSGRESKNLNELKQARAILEKLTEGTGRWSNSAWTALPRVQAAIDRLTGVIPPGEPVCIPLIARRRARWHGPPPAGNVYGEKFLDEPAKLIRCKKPTARASDLAQVVVLVRVDERGKGVFLRALRDTGSLGEAVTPVVSEWLFAPPTVGGQPVKAQVAVSVDWR